MALDPSSSSSHTIAHAETVLAGLRPRVLKLLGGQKLRAGLEYMDILKPERGDPGSAHVLYVGPNLQTEDGRRLRLIGGD